MSALSKGGDKGKGKGKEAAEDSKGGGKQKGAQVWLTIHIRPDGVAHEVPTTEYQRPTHTM